MLAGDQNEPGFAQAGYSAIEAGLSTKNPVKYCDLVGFTARYRDKQSNIRYYSVD